MIQIKNIKFPRTSKLPRFEFWNRQNRDSTPLICKVQYFFFDVKAPNLNKHNKRLFFSLLVHKIRNQNLAKKKNEDKVEGK